MANSYNGLIRCCYRIIYPIYIRLRYLFISSSEGTQIALWSQDKLLVIRNSYRSGLHLPGGHVKSGEDIALNALKELDQECGIRLKVENLSSPTQVCQSKFRVDITDFVFCAYSLDQLAPQIDNREVIFAEFMTPHQIHQHPESLDACLIWALKNPPDEVSKQS